MEDVQLRGVQDEPDSSESQPRDGALHGLRLWVVIGGMFLGVYLVGLDMTMVSTVCIFLVVALGEPRLPGPNDTDVQSLVAN